jgi:hypothetical protein
VFPITFNDDYHHQSSDGSFSSDLRFRNNPDPRVDEVLGRDVILVGVARCLPPCFVNTAIVASSAVIEGSTNLPFRRF